MLRKFFSLLIVFFVTVGLFMHDAEAKRFGGGRSFGIQRSTSSFTRPSFNPGSRFTQGNPRFNQQSMASRWLGPLAGLAAGGLLASLFMHNGMGSGIISWLLIGGLIFLAINLFRSKMQPSTQPRYDDYRQNFAQDAAAQFMRNSTQHSGGQAEVSPSNAYPLGFDSVAFLRDAKVQFIRLQAAYDQKNLNDLREFTTPEVYAEIQMQFQERGKENNKTDVVTLDAELLDATTTPYLVDKTEMQNMVASVRFSGLIQENHNETAATFNEIWHFKKEVANSRWLVAGIQQS